MKWGPKLGQKTSDAEWLSKIARETGKTPSAIAERPSLDVSEMPYWEAFQMLSLSRPNTGFGPGAILLSEIMAYFELEQIPQADRSDLVHTIRAMDAAYLSHKRS